MILIHLDTKRLTNVVKKKGTVDALFHAKTYGKRKSARNLQRKKNARRRQQQPIAVLLVKIIDS